MTLYENWVHDAYTHEGQTNKTYWNKYMPLEKSVYSDLLKEKTGKINMPLIEFAAKYNLKLEQAVGFLDGISGAFGTEIKVEDIEESYIIDVTFDFEILFKKMVEYKAKHLYSLPEWNGFFTEQEQQNMINEQRRSGIFVAEEKPGRNDPCNCGSGKKYKKCCGASA
ncbi:MAG: SEC-C metal-binding domain-containing protein [Defluviitaleaceae bacterium]|nr:SEC-C metal-binding domain-containing protein [Defluviitaleaceae bacterium]